MSDTWYSSEDHGIYPPPYSCLMYWNIAQTSPANTNQKILTASTTNCLKLYDTSPLRTMYNQTSQRIDIVLDGVYVLYGRVYYTSTDNQRWIMFYVNGSRESYCSGHQSGGGLGNDYTVISGTRVATLSSGDYVELYCSGSETNDLGAFDVNFSNNLGVHLFTVT